VFQMTGFTVEHLGLREDFVESAGINRHGGGDGRALR
jgi:hypothetical protein